MGEQVVFWVLEELSIQKGKKSSDELICNNKWKVIIKTKELQKNIGTRAAN